MEAEYRRCCVIDVHQKVLSVCVLPPVGSVGREVKEERFRTFTRDLKRLRNWLKQCGVTDIVMESTGQYWRPVWNILEGGFVNLVLVNPVQVKALAGRKTDRLDANWLATRLERDNLKGSFIPPLEIRELRELTRLRVSLLQDSNRVKNRIGQLCETGNIKVSSVASDLFGTSGRRMLAALERGDRDAGWMADYAQGKLRNKKGELEMALQGTFSDHQRHMLGRMLKQLNGLDQEVADLTEQIEQRVACWPDVMARLTTIPGLDRITAWTVLAEIGTDMDVFGDARHLASWAGLCPGLRESGGKRMSGKTRKGNRYVRRALCQSAWAASRTKDSHLASMFRRIRGRRGTQKANMAVAHHLLTIIFHVIKDGTVYQELGAGYFDQQNKPKVTRKLVERLERLGFAVQLEPIAEPETVLIPEPAAPGVAEAIDAAGIGQPPPSPALQSQPATAPSRRRGRPCKCAERGIDCPHKKPPANRINSPGTETSKKLSH